MKELTSNTRYFVYDYHCAAGRPKMEDAVFQYARDMLLYKIVHQEDFDAIVTSLNQKQQELYAENKRLRQVDVSFTGHQSYYYDDGHRALRIGEQTLRFRRIDGEFSL